jgi:2-polyprenylphenol 6-hydroxylase
VTECFDVIIIGGGIVGATTACALGEAGFDVALVEARTAASSEAKPGRDPRVFAITRASERILRSLQAWDAMPSEDVFAFTDMEVWDAGGGSALHFDCAELGEPWLGHIIEPRIIQGALMERLRAVSQVTLLRPARFREIHIAADEVIVELDDGRALHARLVVGADGVRSPVRDALGIRTREHDYRQSSLVALVRTAESHRHTAWQRFLPGGPLAFLPLEANWCSIVWTRPTAEVERLLMLDRDSFHAELGAAFDFRLGEITDSGEREAWPLQRRHAEHYVTARAALIGDAAHAIHPLAGQGVNLGLLDAATLVQVVQEARNHDRDIGSLRSLRRYERWRRGDNTLMMSAMDGINSLFSNASTPLQAARVMGLGMVNRAGLVRHLLMRHAMGLSGDLPQLARAPAPFLSPG